MKYLAVYVNLSYNDTAPLKLRPQRAWN